LQLNFSAAAAFPAPQTETIPKPVASVFPRASQQIQEAQRIPGPNTELKLKLKGNRQGEDIEALS